MTLFFYNLEDEHGKAALLFSLWFSADGFISGYKSHYGSWYQPGIPMLFVTFCPADQVSEET